MAIETTMKRAGYKYYVYLGPGRIEYFMDYQLACEYAEQHRAEVSSIDI